MSEHIVVASEKACIPVEVYSFSIYSIPSSGQCTDKSAVTWSLQHGQLAHSDGKYCVARTTDNLATLVSCSSAFEFVGMEVPTLHRYEWLCDYLLCVVCVHCCTGGYLRFCIEGMVLTYL